MKENPKLKSAAIATEHSTCTVTTESKRLTHGSSEPELFSHQQRAGSPRTWQRWSGGKRL